MILSYLINLRKNGDFFVTFPSNVVERIKGRSKKGSFGLSNFSLKEKNKRGDREREVLFWCEQRNVVCLMMNGG